MLGAKVNVIVMELGLKTMLCDCIVMLRYIVLCKIGFFPLMAASFVLSLNPECVDSHNKKVFKKRMVG